MTKSTYLLCVSTGSIPAASTISKIRKCFIFKHLLLKRVMYRVMCSHDFVTVSHHFVNKPDTKPETKTAEDLISPAAIFMRFRFPR